MILNISRGYQVIIDEEDYIFVSKFNWYAEVDSRTGHVYASYRPSKKKPRIWLHRLLLNTNSTVDHINGNTLDNRKVNLRICGKKENNRNSGKTQNKFKSNFKGVTPIGNKFRARIRVNGNLIHIGYFLTEVQAAEAYNKAATKYFGEFARLNRV